MPNKDDTCHYCNRLAVDTRRVVVDVDAGHDGDEWYAHPLYSEVGLCQEHLDAYENGELEDNEREG